MRRDEIIPLRDRLSARWDTRGKFYWYPLSSSSIADKVAVRASAFHASMPDELIRDLLCPHDVRRLFELREGPDSYELDLGILVRWYNGLEGYWFTGEIDRLIFASHEDTLTVAGWLVEPIKEAWPATLSSYRSRPFAACEPTTTSAGDRAWPRRSSGDRWRWTS